MASAETLATVSGSALRTVPHELQPERPVVACTASPVHRTTSGRVPPAEAHMRSHSCSSSAVSCSAPRNARRSAARKRPLSRARVLSVTGREAPALCCLAFRQIATGRRLLYPEISRHLLTLLGTKCSLVIWKTVFVCVTKS